MKIFSTLVNAILAIRVANALMNDWKKPCTNGECYWDLPHHRGFSPGSLMISGAPHAITDITGAADWEILDCHPNKTEQDIRLVCSSPFGKCGHLFRNGGAEDKILRLPDTCGLNPFGRVVKTWDATDRSLPPHVAARLSRRYRTLPPVKSLRFDVDFHKIDAQKMGTVNFAILGSTHPGVADKIHTQLSRSPPGKHDKRGLFGAIHHALDKAVQTVKDGVDGAANKVKDGVEGAANNVKDGAEGAANKVKDGVEEAANKVKDGVEEAANKVKNATQQAVHDVKEGVDWLKDHSRFNVDPHVNISLINVVKNGTVFKQAIGCPPLVLGIDIEMDLHADARVTFSMAITGTIIPPSIDEFKLIPTFDADVEGTITLRSHIAVSLDTGTFPLFQVGIPGLVVPGIFSLGPTFKVGIRGLITLDLSLGITLGLNYHIGHTQLTLPNGADNGVNDFAMHNSPIHLSLTPLGAGAILFQPTFYLTLDLGLSAFGREAAVSLVLESYIRSTVTLGANAGTIHPREAEGVDADFMDGLLETGLEERSIFPGPKSPSTKPETTGQPGCIEVNAFFDFNFDSDSDMFGFKAYHETTFFRKEFFLYKKCFMMPINLTHRALDPDLPAGVEEIPELHRGTVTNRRPTSSGGSIPVLPRLSVPVAKRGLACLNGSMLYGVVPVVDDVTSFIKSL